MLPFAAVEMVESEFGRIKMRMHSGQQCAMYLLFKVQVLTHNSYFKVRLADFSVFLSNMAMVIGPTPPGTGVIQLATSLTSS